MKLLPGPFGWDSYGVVVHVELTLIGGPAPLDPHHRAAIIDALANHSAYPGAWGKILGCLEHSVYQCLMRPAIAKEIFRAGTLRNAGVEFIALALQDCGFDGISWHTFDTPHPSNGPKWPQWSTT